MESTSLSRFVTDSINYLNSFEECRNSQSTVGSSKDNPIQVELAQTQRKLEELDYQLRQQNFASRDGQSLDCALKFKVLSMSVIKIQCYIRSLPLKTPLRALGRQESGAAHPVTKIF